MTDPQVPGDRTTTAIIRAPVDALARVILDICQPQVPTDRPRDRDDDAAPAEHEAEPC
jgi:hypothetical protein